MANQFTKSVAIACQNNAVPAPSQRKYIARGLWAVDFNTEYSFQSAHASSTSRSEAGEVFNRIEEASRAGGIGTLRSDDSQLIAVGRFGTNGICLSDQVGDSGKKGTPVLRIYDSWPRGSEVRGGTGYRRYSWGNCCESKGSGEQETAFRNVAQRS